MSAGKGRGDVSYENPRTSPAKSPQRASQSVISVDLHYARVGILNNVLFSSISQLFPFARSLAHSHTHIRNIHIIQSYKCRFFRKKDLSVSGR